MADDDKKKTLTILTPCYNEEKNVEEVYRRVRDQVRGLQRYHYEHIFIDNASTDRTVDVLKRLAEHDHNIKIIVNSRNFGHIRSPMHALMQSRGDAVIGIVADLQDPPELIPTLVEKWESGFAMVLCVKRSSEENPLMFWVRKKYYQIIGKLSSIETFENFTGFGLYDRKVVDAVHSFRDPYPYFRGLIAEIGLPHCKVLYDQPTRKTGKSKTNLYALYDMAMVAITNLSKVPLRVVTFSGFVGAVLSMLVALLYLGYKLIYWDSFSAGVAPVVIGLSFFSSIQMLSLGIVGEYIGTIHTNVQARPYVIERERVNFEHPPGEPLADDLHTETGAS